MEKLQENSIIVVEKIQKNIKDLEKQLKEVKAPKPSPANTTPKNKKIEVDLENKINEIKKQSAAKQKELEYLNSELSKKVTGITKENEVLHKEKEKNLAKIAKLE